MKFQCVYVCTLFLRIGAVPATLVVPQEIWPVNGSDITMGCASPLVDRGGVMVCNNSESYLVDGQLVTLRKNDGDDIIERVLLTFVFDTAVSLDRIELDMFLCPDWNIEVSYIDVYADVDSTLVYSHKSTRIGGSYPRLSSCNSLSPDIVYFGDVQRSSSYHTWHIIVEADSDTEWIYVGEVRFLEKGSTPTPTSMLRNDYSFCIVTHILLLPTRFMQHSGDYLYSHY